MSKGNKQKSKENKKLKKAVRMAKKVKERDVHNNFTDEQFMVHQLYETVMADKSIPRADKEELEREFIVTRAVQGECLQIPKKYIEDVANKWVEMSNLPDCTREEKEGYMANAQYMRTINKMVADGCCFTQIGW